MKSKIALSQISLGVIFLIAVFVSSNISWGGDKWMGILEADAKGYYAYLPAVFIYNDLNFGFFDQIEKDKYYNENLYYDYRAGANGKMVNKYFSGTALAQSPFFIMAHLSSYLSGYETDGYSKLYPIFINIGALLYLILGLYFLSSTLSTYGVNEWQKSLTLFAAVFGTNLFYYSAVEPGLSHIYSFAFVSMFVWYSRNYFLTFQGRDIVILAAILGIIVLIRPVNGLVIFIWPMLAGSLTVLKKGFRVAAKNYLSVISGAVVFLLLISMQLVIYKISSGQFFVDSYGEEGFNFLSPRMLAILFSYKKGLFLYTPMYLLSFAGCYFLWRSSRFAVWSWLGFFLLITYIFSSWWNWYYGGSFSSRVYVEFLPAFMILLAISIKQISRLPWRSIYTSFIFLLIVVCQIQTYQYRYYEIHWSDMTKEKYWDVFLRVDRL